MKSNLKSLLYSWGLSTFLDKILFLKSYLTNYSSNRKFKKKNPNFVLPPNYYLYETFQLNYKKYFAEGKLSAKEIIDWSKPYLKLDNIKILEWGCGVARTCRHLKQSTSSATQIYACDVNENMIKWCKDNIDEINFSVIPFLPPTAYKTNLFNIAFGISIFTHIPAEEQESWLIEINRILDEGGIFIFSTHGKYYLSKLTESELCELNNTGFLLKSILKKVID